MYFADALSGGPLLGRLSAPMRLVPRSGPLPPAVDAYLQATSGGITLGMVFGGPLAVGSNVTAELVSAIS